MRRILLVIIISFLASSCAHVISKDARSKARKDVSFRTVAEDPFFYEGSLFIWGGVIVKTSLTNEGSVIEIRQSLLDRYGAPEDTDVSEGRFLVRSKRHLDPLIYETGREITVAGVLTGTSRRPLGEIEYVYPVLEAREIFLFKEDIYYYSPYYYDPWYYDPWYYDTWYYDPWYRWPRHRYPYWRRH